MYPQMHALAYTHQSMAGVFIMYVICETLPLCLVMKMSLLLLCVGAERSTSIRKASSTTQGHLDLGKPVNGFTRFVSENDHFF